MSEWINNSSERKRKLKELILKLHQGDSASEVRDELVKTLHAVPYNEVVEVEQQLINEGLPAEEVLKLCDVHSAVLHGNIDLSSLPPVPPGHPADVMLKENIELKKVVAEVKKCIKDCTQYAEVFDTAFLLHVRELFNRLMDVDKHYQRKEYLLFPFLEQKGITGPPKVMWGKHDEIRELLKGSIEALQTPGISRDDFLASADILLKPALSGILDMCMKEEEILLPMALDRLTESEWHDISRQSVEIGFCLYDPPVEWKSQHENNAPVNDINAAAGHIQLPSGSFSVDELTAVLNTLPVDITFVDKNDKVRYFSQNPERIFQRTRAILNRDVRHCHPPASAHIVDKIIDDFKTGRASRAPFWIRMQDKFVHIEYFAVRGSNGEYLGTLEVSHDVSVYRKLEGEQRILSYTR